jgi:hypothetical protein
MSGCNDIVEGSEILITGRTEPVPIGPQPASKSLPTVIATDQEPIPFREVDKQLSEVSLSLLGYPRQEGRQSLYADVTSYDITPREWQAQASSAIGSVTILEGGNNATALRFLPSESAGQIVSSAAAGSGLYGILASKRTFRYQPGRISGCTLGISLSLSEAQNDIKKYGAYDNFDGYYFEVQGGSQQPKDFNFYCVRRSSAYAARVTPSLPGETGTAGTNCVITRDGLTLIHAGLFDQSLRVLSGGTLITTGSISFRVQTQFAFTYEYRIPRKYFAYDKLDGQQNQPSFYADRVPGGESFTLTLAGTADNPIVNYQNGTIVEDGLLNSDWDIDLSNVTMYQIDFSWYGAVGALFLAYVPDLNSPGDARWVRLHHIRGSNQLKTATLSNAFLPITYYTSRGQATESWIKKYGASWYIDGGDEGTFYLNSADSGNLQAITSARSILAIRLKTGINNLRNRMQVYPSKISIFSSAAIRVRLRVNPTVTGTPTWGTSGALSPVESAVTNVTLSGGRTIDTIYCNGAYEIPLGEIFGFDREYLSFPRTASAGDTFFIEVEPLSGTANVAASMLWKEQS